MYITLLKEEEFIQGNIQDEASLELTLKGKIACQLRRTALLGICKIIRR